MNPTLLGWSLVGFLVWSITIGTGAYFKGKAQCELQHEAAQKTHTEQVLDTRSKNEVSSNKEVGDTIKYVEVIKWKTKEVIKNVPAYISKSADDSCVVPVGFVRLHDLSASESGQENYTVDSITVYDTPSKIKLSTVGETIAENYGTYHSEMKRFEGLQQWVVKYCQ
jgi:hypothetical protein